MPKLRQFSKKPTPAEVATFLPESVVISGQPKALKNRKKRGLHSSYISTIVTANTGLHSRGQKQGIKASERPKPTTQENLKKRAKAKAFTCSYVEKLLLIPDSPLAYSYKTTLYCASVLHQQFGKITTRYCNQRWCMVCNRIRIARAINGYLPELEKLLNPQFVTLTVPNVPASDLPATIAVMLKVWRDYYVRCKKAGLQMKGIRKLECTYNYFKDNYHPHFHIILEGGQPAAEHLIRSWLDAWPKANIKGQHFKPADSGSMVELFKYFTKIVTKPKKDLWQEGEQDGIFSDEDEQDEQDENYNIPADPAELAALNAKLFKCRKYSGRIFIPALDTIFKSMKRRQVFTPFGIKKFIPETFTDLQAQEIEGQLGEVVNVYENTSEGIKDQVIAVYWLWNQKKADWLQRYSKVRLTGNKPERWLEHYMKGAVF